MSENSFSIRIMSLKFNQKAISQVIFGFFLLGVLMGAFSIIHIGSVTFSSIIAMPLFWAAIIPIVVIVNGIRKAEIIKNDT